MTMTSFLEVAQWLNPPAQVVTDEHGLVVTAEQGSDFWRKTSYGFTRDTGHALTVPVTGHGSLEVDFLLDYDQLFDQAGIVVRDDATTWVKSGVEISDGVAHVGAVVTHESSDWSLAPVPTWSGSLVTVRASWSGGALTLRARPAGGAWRTLRVAPYRVTAATRVGLYVCAPERAGLSVTFTDVRLGRPDTELHADPPA